MAEPTLTEVFGAGATQTATTLTITKANLTSLIASANNRAEELLVAILLNAAINLTDAQRQADVTNRNVTIAAGLPSFVTSNQLQFRRDILNVLLYKADSGSNIVPGDY